MYKVNQSTEILYGRSPLARPATGEGSYQAPFAHISAGKEPNFE